MLVIEEDNVIEKKSISMLMLACDKGKLAIV